MKRYLGDLRFPIFEVLIVVVTLLLAASLLVPIFTRARGKANGDFSCLSQQRQIATSALMHVQDHKGQFPGVDWVGTLNKYLSSPEMYTDSRYGGKNGEVNYAYNAWLLRADGAGIHEDQITIPPAVGLFCDATPAMRYPQGGLIGRGLLTIKPIHIVQPHNRHVNGLIASFADGHAKYIPEGYKLGDKSNPVVRAFYQCKTLGYLKGSTSAK